MNTTVRNRAGTSGRWLLCRVLAAFVLLGATAACSAPSTASGATVVFVGDSLAVQAAQYLPSLLTQRTLAPQVYGGTAPCDWLDTDLQIKADSVVVISFVGNSGSPCMADGAGGFLQGQAIIDKYRADVSVLIETARTADVEVLLVGQPARFDSVAGNEVVVGLNAVYTELASADGVAFVDAGAAVENPDGTFAFVLPCVPNEAECDASGNNVVRSDDGLHFCPGTSPPGECQVYSSGAFRFAKAIADAIVSS